MSYIEKSRRILKYFYFRIVRSSKDPEFIARGLALGMFIGMTPTMGFQMAIGVFIATLLRENIIATAAMVWITNPLTFIPIYSFNYAIGKLILKQSLEWNIDARSFTSMKSLFSMGWDFIYTLWVGCIVVGIVLSIITYYVSIPMIRKYQEKLKMRRLKRKDLKKLKKMLKDETPK